MHTYTYIGVTPPGNDGRLAVPDRPTTFHNDVTEQEYKCQFKAPHYTHYTDYTDYTHWTYQYQSYQSKQAHILKSFLNSAFI